MTISIMCNPAAAGKTTECIQAPNFNQIRALIVQCHRHAYVPAKARRAPLSPCCSSNLACRWSERRLLVEGRLTPVEHSMTNDLVAHRYQASKLEWGGSHTELTELVQPCPTIERKRKMFHLPARSIALAALSATLLIAANPLAAAETHSIAVQSSDLNLAKGADRTTLQQRIAHAVGRICGSAHGRTTADVQAYATCSKTARAGVSAQYDAMIAKAQRNTKVASDRKNTTAAE